MKWTLSRVLQAVVVRVAQGVTGDRETHARLKSRVLGWRERRPRAVDPAPFPAEFRRIVVCKTEQRGDVLLAIPALRALRARFPQARITALAGPWGREILTAVAEVDDVLVLEHPPLAFERGRLPTEAETAELVGRLRAGAFDLAVDLSGDSWTIRRLEDAGIPVRIGPAETGESQRLHRTARIPPELHRVDAMLAIVGLVGARAEDGRPRLEIPAPVRDEARGISAATGIAEPYVVLHPGGRELKRWPTEHFVALAASLLETSNDQVVLVAGPDEADLVRAFAPLAAGGRVKTWPAGTFLALGAMLAGARLFVGSDSGVAHLAAAVGTPTVTLFGPARVAHWAPRSVRGAVVSHDERCSYPCWPAVYDEPCSHHRCLRRITVDEVRTVVATELRRDPQGRKRVS